MNFKLNTTKLYKKDGLVPPSAIIEATKCYFETNSEDLVKDFICENYELLRESSSTFIRTTDIYTQFQDWCKKISFQNKEALNVSQKTKNKLDNYAGRLFKKCELLQGRFGKDNNGNIGLKGLKKKN